MAKEKILMIGEYEKAMYHPMTDIDDLFKNTFSNFSFTFSTNPNELENISDYDLVISYWDDWNTKISDEAAKTLDAYVLNGGSFLVLHNGISLQLQDNLKNMIGAGFITHPTAESIIFLPTEDTYTDSVPAFEIKEEPYQFEMIPDNKVILLNYIYRNEEYPAGWKKNYGKGKIVYLCPGHTISSFKVDGYIKLIEKCIKRLITHNRGEKNV